MKEMSEYLTEHVDLIVFWFLWALAMGFSLTMVGFVLALMFKKPDKNIVVTIKRK